MVTMSIGAKSQIISKISELEYIDKGITNMLKIVVITLNKNNFFKYNHSFKYQANNKIKP